MAVYLSEDGIADDEDPPMKAIPLRIEAMEIRKDDRIIVTVPSRWPMWRREEVLRQVREWLGAGHGKIAVVEDNVTIRVVRSGDT
jgi:hypothetical protein